MLGRALFCAKGACDTATPFGVGLGLMLGVDQVLKDGGREAFFGPTLGVGLNRILPKGELEHWRDTYLEAANNLNNATKSDKFLMELVNQTTDLEDLSVEDKKDLFQLLSELQTLII